MGSYDAAPAHWETLVARKQTEVLSRLPTNWKLPVKTLEGLNSPITIFKERPQFLDGIFSADDIDITENYSAVALLEKMAQGHLTSTEVTTAFCKRAAVAQQLTSCLTETLYDEALERAAFLDCFYEKEKKTYGPLHGLPISVKDSFSIKGIQTTLGFVSFLDGPTETENSPLINILLQAGAVLYVKTNIPMTLMTADSQNNIFGRTLNPYNTLMTAGGSSGGEGALVAMRGSPLGVGTDIAGSIRIPALCCGLYGFKPSSGRVPYGGQTSASRAGFPGIDACAGPLATSVADLDLFLSTVLSSKPWLQDSTAHAVHWRTLPGPTSSDKLTIGILAEDPKFPLQPPIRRVMEEAITALKTAGHTMVPLARNEASSVELANTIVWQYFMLDPSETSMKHILASGEPPIPSIQKTRELVTSVVKQIPLDDVAELNARRKEFKGAWHNIFQSHKLDVVIGPAAQHTAVGHDTFGIVPYTSIWNVLDYPACVIPYSAVSRELDPPAEISFPAVGQNFDLNELHGLPCSIQIIAPHFYDEELLRAVKIIDKVLKP